MTATLVSGGHSLTPDDLYLDISQTGILSVKYRNSGDESGTFMIVPFIRRTSDGAEKKTNELGAVGWLEAYIPPLMTTDTEVFTFTFSPAETGTWYYCFWYKEISDVDWTLKEYPGSSINVNSGSPPGGEIQVTESHASKYYIFNITDYNKAWIYATLKNVGEDDTFEYRSYMKRISDGQKIYINDSSDWDHWASPSGDTDGVQKSFVIGSGDKGEWRYYIEYTKYTEGHSITHTIETATIVNVIDPYGKLTVRSPTSATPSTITIGQSSDIILTVENTGYADDTFSIAAQLKRRSDGLLRNLAPVWSPPATIAMDATDNHTYTFTAPTGSDGTYDLVIYYTTSTGYQDTLSTSVVLIVQSNPGQLQVTSASATPSSFLLGDNSTISVSIKNIGGLDWFNIGGQLRRKSDGHLIGLEPVWDRIQLDTDDTDSHNYQIDDTTFISGDEGVYDLEIVYVRESDMIDEILTTSVVVTVSSSSQVCGNEIIEGSEVCDGINLNGKTCEDFGYIGGTLKCNPNCMSYDFSECIPPEEEKKSSIIPLILAGAGTGIVLYGLTKSLRRKKRK